MLQNWILPKDKMQGTIKELLDALGLVISIINLSNLETTSGWKQAFVIDDNGFVLNLQM